MPGTGTGWETPGSVNTPAAQPSSGGSGLGTGWEAPGGGVAPPHSGPAPAGGGGVGGFLSGIGHFASGVGHTLATQASRAGHLIAATPGGLASQANTAVIQPFWATAHGHNAFDQNSVYQKNIGKVIDQNVASIEHTINHPGENWLATAMLAAPALHGVGRVGIGAAEAGSALKAGEGVGAAAARFRTPDTLTAPRTLRQTGGESVTLNSSRNALRRGYQAAHDAYVQRMMDSKPNSRVAAYGASRVHGSLAEVARARVRMRQAVTSNLRAATQPLKGEIARAAKSIDLELKNAPKTIAQAAIELVSHNTTPEEAILRAEHAIRQGINPELNAANVDLYTEIEHLDLVHTLGAEVGINPEFERTARAEAILHEGGTALDQQIAERGLRPVEQLESRRNLPAAVTQRLKPFAEKKVTPALREASDQFERVDRLYNRALQREHDWHYENTQDVADASMRVGGRSVELNNPYRERVVALGHMHEEALQRLQRLEKRQGKGRYTVVPEDLQARSDLIRFATEKFGREEALNRVGLIDRRAGQFGHENDIPATEFYKRHLRELETSPTLEHHNGLLEIAPFHGFPEEKTNANLRGKLNPRTQKSGMPTNRKVRTGAGHVFAGKITPEEWLHRVESTHATAAERDFAARWYQHFEPLFRKEFPEDVADRIIRAFSVSQANASPSAGVASSLVAMTRLDRGEDVGSIGSVVADNIEKALKGDPIDSHVAAKLSDFIDALRGSSTRTWMGHAPEGGAPAPIDIWGLRDLGYIDKKIASKGRDARLQRMHGVDVNKLTVDNPGSASGARYERAAEQYTKVTDHLNAIRYDGRDDWTPSQVQALGWASIQKFYGQEPEDLATAISKGRIRAQGILKRADVQKVVESAREPDGGFTLHADLTPDLGKDGYAAAYAHFEKRIPAAEFTAQDLTAYTRAHRDLLANPSLRVGGWHNPADGHVYLDISRVFPTREEAMAFAHEHGQLSVFDRAAATRGDWGAAFPESGLSEEAADAIKSVAREKVSAPQRYNDLIDRWATDRFSRDGKPSQLDRRYAEDQIHAWADANPHEPLAQQFKKLFNDAHEMKSMRTPPPEALFSSESFHEAAARELQAFAGMARDIAKTIPEAEWPAWVRNQIRAQSSGEMEKMLAGDHSSSGLTIPEDWLKSMLPQEAHGVIRGAYSPKTATMAFSEKHAIPETVTHEALHAIRQSLPELLQRKFERRYDVRNGQWTRADEEHFVSDMLGVHNGTVTDPELVRNFHQLTDFVPGRTWTPLKTLEGGTPTSIAARSQGPVVGLAADPLESHFTTGSGLLGGRHQEDVIDATARHWHNVFRFFNTQDWRNMIAKTGNDVRRSDRDILVRVDNRAEGGVHVNAEKLTTALETLLGRKRDTSYMPEMEGEDAAIMASLQKFVTDMFPGTVEDFAETPLGEPAPAGHVWVDSKVVGDVALPSLGRGNAYARFFDNVNAAVTAATVYFKLGHFLTRVLTNAATNIMQGSASPLNIKESLSLWHELAASERLDALAASGTHYYEAIPGATGETRIARAVQHGVGPNHALSPHWWATVVDAPFRFNSLSYEVRKSAYGGGVEGIRSFLGDLHNYNALDEAQRAEVDGVVRRANQQAIAYDRLNASERAIFSRAIWFYPWVKGSSVWTMQQFFEHPWKSAYLANSGVQGMREQKAAFGDLPTFSYGLFELAHGKPFPLTANWSTFNPEATLGDVLQIPQHFDTAGGMANPALGTIAQLARSTDAYGTHTNHPVSSALQSLVSATPESQIADAYLGRHDDQSHREFPAVPGDPWSKTYLGQILRSLIGPGTPRRFNPEAAHSLAERERTGR